MKNLYYSKIQVISVILAIKLRILQKLPIKGLYIFRILGYTPRGNSSLTIERLKKSMSSSPPERRAYD